jgi:hypothetical protein
MAALAALNEEGAAGGEKALRLVIAAGTGSA